MTYAPLFQNQTARLDRYTAERRYTESEGKYHPEERIRPMPMARQTEDTAGGVSPPGTEGG